MDKDDFDYTRDDLPKRTGFEEGPLRFDTPEYDRPSRRAMDLLTMLCIVTAINSVAILGIGVALFAWGP